MDRISIHQSPALPVWKQPLEIVERKGKGHPDTICDTIADRISIQLAKAYEEAFGRILHYNIDKCLLVAGHVDCRLGGGHVIEPMRLIVGDRATLGYGGKSVPVNQIVVDTGNDWFQHNMPHLNPHKHVQYQIELKPSSEELEAIFQRGRGPLPANDTSAAVGYAPLTPTERLVLEVEHHLNGAWFKKEFPETGEDVKVMAVRQGHELRLTVAMPFLAHTIRSEKAYFQLKAKVFRAIKSFVRHQPHKCKEFAVALNTLDRPKQGLGGMYLSLLGTSAEQGDSGQVGRGNRACGVISLNRPMSGEAAAGKNPVSHVGKIYNVLAHEMADRVYHQVPGVEEVTIWLVSSIGQRVDHPMMAAAQVALKRGMSLKRISLDIETIIQEHLNNIRTFCSALAKGEYPVC